MGLMGPMRPNALRLMKHKSHESHRSHSCLVPALPGAPSDDQSPLLKRFHRCRKPNLVERKSWEHGSKTNKYKSTTGYRHRTSQEKRSSRKSVGLPDPRYRRGAEALRVRGRVVSVVLRSDDDDLCIESTRAALPLAGFLPSDCRDLASSDDQCAVDAGGGRIKPCFPPERFLTVKRLHGSRPSFASSIVRRSKSVSSRSVISPEANGVAMIAASVALRRTYEQRFDDGLPLITDLLITSFRSQELGYPHEPRYSPNTSGRKRRRSINT
jgi:hypothetical protein